MSLKIFNTLSGEKEEFVPLTPGRVRMYVCGVTPYDSAHLGHCRFLITFDVIYRYLRWLGFDVAYVRNFTDVDDKIIKRANEEHVASDVISERYIAEFHRDSEALGLAAPTTEPRATEHIADIIKHIKKLEAQGLAYQVDGDVFFPVERFVGYGKLSRKNIDELESGARVEVDERKRSPLDFALWKSSKPGEPTWESPWGVGRPGWHIECSAMSTKYLGQPFDIHGGGRDLIFPHHENEIAQSEGAFGVLFARFWLHNGFLNINQEKMSKSLGNFFTIREILNDFDSAALRHYFLASQYRSPMDFSKDGLTEAARAVDRIYETLDRIDQATGGRAAAADAELLEAFRREMDDDFNTPRALALVFDEVRALNRLLDGKKTQGIDSRGTALGAICDTLGLQRDGYAERKKQRFLDKANISVRHIEELIEQRNQARAAKNWQEADRIREQLIEHGVLLEDTAKGTIWKVK